MDAERTPTLANVLAWHPQRYALFPLLCALLAAFYAVGLIRLRQRGIRWPIGRTVSWIVGVGLILWVTATGIEGYGMAVFSVHMFQHMILTMLAPVFLLMGAPVTMLLRTLPAGKGRRAAPRRALVLLLHFIVTGIIFFGPVLMIDPWPGTKSYIFRIMLMLSSLPFHAFFAIAVMMSPAPIVHFFATPPPSWNIDVMGDHLWAGGLTWVFGDAPTLVVMLALAILWIRSDDRLTRRSDRQAERDGDAELNAYLQRLADHEAARSRAHGPSAGNS
ncbi:MAG: cytochrome c oxidase assembly protein [Nocardiopsaceae bacterium]|nr:cytochrome c oxidase assembly protein [Nocardiopsaceae bacterium]